MTEILRRNCFSEHKFLIMANRWWEPYTP